ncbi:nucleotide sugar dehydrogenase [Halorussus ruber]|uniref:nucleotide sugar dehydrogenase n=1 Tax=Halorussus ruber TaxID=1126238 RepID=UPI0010929087|nr:nucleotide sugar dehydrogenase [Halorussus ruber]
MSSSTSRVCIHGLGYIGLPTAAMLANVGYEVVGFDTDEAVLDRIERRDLQFDEPDLRELVSDALAGDDLVLADEPVPADYHLVCVPTPLDESNKEANLSAVEAASGAVADQLAPGDTVVVESTVPPGTTAETVRPLLEETGLDASEDFLLAYSPETVLPGNVVTELRQNDRIVGGIGEEATRSAAEFYDSFVEGTIYRTDATTAEFAKLSQNTYRDVNIALANEIAKLADEHGVDSREAIRLGNTHPRVDLHRPGPGVGGHCVPVDPWFLGTDSDETDLIETAREVNDEMVEYVTELLGAHLGDLSDRRIAVLGVAYKGNVADVRQSPTLRLADELESAGADARFHDSHVRAETVSDGGPSGPGGQIAERESPGDAESSGDETAPSTTENEKLPVELESLADATDDADALVVMTDHDEYEGLNPDRLADRMATPVIVDAKSVIDREEWTENEFDVSQI